MTRPCDRVVRVWWPLRLQKLHMSDINPLNGARAPGADARHAMIIGALGVVYGDIGTSPLYALRQSLISYGGDVNDQVVMGTLSLVAWALILVITFKYITVVMRADNRGEGGALALTALVLRASNPDQSRYRVAMIVGLLGAAMFFGDGIITPAISVLSAVEGLNVATPFFEPYVVPISLALLVVLFAAQRTGTASLASLFGPIMLVWFVVLSALGVINIAQSPEILRALNPMYGIELFAVAPWHAFVMLGAVVLVVTGGETLYADMGHFGRTPMRIAWLYIVFPALLLNYYGQGALLLANPEAIENPFYMMVPAWAVYPLVVLSSLATIIASQAVISGAFSITRAAVQLGYLPRVRVLHTSESEIGQVYVPRINSLLLFFVILLVIGFQSSDELGGAYGIAMAGMMTMTTMQAILYARTVWKWNLAATGAVFGVIGTIDLAFLSSSLLKIDDGGWFPILVAACAFSIMSTWWRGRQMLRAERARSTIPVKDFIAGLKPDRPGRVAGTAIFMTPEPDNVPSAMLHAIKHYKVLHQRVVLMRVETDDIPHVTDEARLQIDDLGQGFLRICVRYGYMDQPNIVRALAQCRQQNIRFNLMETSFVVGREKIVPSGHQSVLARWRKRLFVLMNNNALDATEFFRIPPNRVVELGGQFTV